MKKNILSLSIMVLALVLVCTPVFAASTGNISNVINNTFTFNLQEVKNDVLKLVQTGAPYALGIMGIMLSLKLGVRFFKRTAK